MKRTTAMVGWVGVMALVSFGGGGYAMAQTPDATGDDIATAAAMNEIVVTARKREERLLDVPLSVEAFGAAELESNFVDNVENLFGKVPSLYFSSNVLSPGNDFVNLVIRGVGAQGAGTPAVATFVDGVYVPALAFDSDFMDVERVEVLRGPQGTLFGRNTEGGALSIVLRRPDAQVRRKVAFTADSFDGARGQLAMSGPLSDRVFGSVSGNVETSDGYLRDDVVVANSPQPTSVRANDYRKYAGRAALRFTPSDAWDINLAADVSRRAGPDGYPGVPRGSHDYLVRSEFQLDAVSENYGGALTAEYKAGSFLVSTITGYRHLTSSLPFDFDGSPEFTGNLHDLRTSQEILSEEVRISGSAMDKKLQWLAGVYGFTEKHDSDRAYTLPQVLLFPNGVLLPADNQHLKRDGFSAFTDVTFTVFDKLDLNAGLRASHESTDSHILVDLRLPDLLGPGQDLAVREEGTASLSDHDVSATAALTYRWTKSLSTYARFAQGDKAGGFPLAPAGASSNIPFDAEHSTNYEVGLKANLFDGRLGLATSVYYIALKDQQLSTVVFLNGDPNLPIASVGNAGRSRSQGVEFSADIKATRNLDFSLDAGYTDAKYTEYVDTVGKDRSGERFPFVPQWTAQGSINYAMTLSENYSLDLNSSYRYVDRILSGSGVDIDLQFPIKSYDLVDARATLSAKNWKIDLFCENLTNRFVETRVFNAFFYPPSRPFSIVLPPRRTGVRFTYEF